MKIRKQDANGDMVFGGSQNDFWINVSQAVGQAAQNKLQLAKGTFWRDLNAGIPLFQQILGSLNTASNFEIVTGIIQQQIASVQGVSDVSAVDPFFNPTTRQYLFSCTITTIYSSDPLQLLINDKLGIYTGPIPLVPPPPITNQFDFTDGNNSEYIPLL